MYIHLLLFLKPSDKVRLSPSQPSNPSRSVEEVKGAWHGVRVPALSLCSSPVLLSCMYELGNESGNRTNEKIGRTFGVSGQKSVVLCCSSERAASRRCRGQTSGASAFGVRIRKEGATMNVTQGPERVKQVHARSTLGWAQNFLGGPIMRWRGGKRVQGPKVCQSTSK